MAATVAMGFLAASAPAVALLPQSGTVASAGHVRYETSGGRYHLPGVGPFQFRGPVVLDGKVVALQLDGGQASLDTATMTFPAIPVSSPNGRLHGSCDVPYPPTFIGPPHQQLTLRCDVSVDGGEPQPLILATQAAGHVTKGDPIYGIQRTVHDGVFTAS